MRKKVTLVFRRLENAEFELHSLGVDGLVSTASNRGDKSSGKYFQWKPGSGIVPLSLFFVRAAKAIAMGHPGPIDSEQLKGYQGHLIWGGEMGKNGSIPKSHPQSTIRQSLINNRHRWSLYLYRLFYQEGFRERGIEFDDLNSPDSGLDVKTELNKIERRNDQLPHTLRNEYDTLIFLGCMLVRREPKAREGRKFWVYFCTRPNRDLEVEVKLLSESGTESIATSEDLNQIDDALSTHFDIGDKRHPKEEVSSSESQSNLEPVSEPSSPIPVRTNSDKTKIKLAFGIMIMVLIALGTLLWHKLVIPNPVVLETNETILTVFNSDGKVLWKRDLKGPIESKNCHVADLDGDGLNEVIVAFLGYEEASLGGKVLIFDGRQNLKWEYALNDPSPFDCTKSGKYAIRELYVDDYLQVGRQQVLVLWYDARNWCASCAGLLDSDGTPMWTFWHPGHLSTAVAGSPTKGERKRIIFEAINNFYADIIPGPFPENDKSEFPRALFMLDTLPSGMAPPFHQGSHQGFNQLQWYQLISPEPIGLQRLEIIDEDHDGYFRIAAWFKAGRAFYLDFTGNKIGEIEKPGSELDVQLVKVFPNDETELPIDKLLKPDPKPDKTAEE